MTGCGPWTKLVPLEELEPGGIRAFTVHGLELLLCRVGEDVYAVENLCSHADYPLSDGDLVESSILCPLHGAMFDLASGTPLCPPAEQPIRTFPTKLEDGCVWVRTAD